MAVIYDLRIKAGTGAGNIAYTINTPKTVLQGRLSTSIVTIYTSPVPVQEEIKKIQLANLSSSAVADIIFYAQGSTTSHQLNSKFTIPADGTLTWEYGEVKIYDSTGAAISAFTISLTLTGDVTGTGSGSMVTTIANNAVTNAKAADMATKTYKGRTTAGTGDPEDVSITTLKTDLSLGNVDNTSDVNKPVSTAQAAAIGAKQDSLVSGTNIKTINSTTLLGSGDMQVSAFAKYGRAKYGTSTSYSLPGVVVTATSTVVGVINQLYYEMIWIENEIVLDQMAFYVTVAPGSSARVRIGIYAADVDWQPTGSPLVDNEISVTGTFTGAKTQAISLTLPKGRYLIARNLDVAMTFRTWRGFPPCIGIDPALGASNIFTGGNVASAYGALPSIPVAWATPLNAGDHPILLRILTP